MLGTLVIVYGWYFVTIGRQLVDTPASDISYGGAMIATVAAVVVLAVIGHVLIAVASPGSEGLTDERDKLIDLKGEWFGGFALGTGTLAGLLMAIAEVEPFWIANVLLAAMVLSEVVTSVAKLIMYRATV
jgi:hypothetical protein